MFHSRSSELLDRRCDTAHHPTDIVCQSAVLKHLQKLKVKVHLFALNESSQGFSEEGNIIIK